MRYKWYITGTVCAAIPAVALLLCSRPRPCENNSAGELRIVSLAPGVTEMLFALNLADCIVGVTDRCDYPPEAKDIERVGGFGTPNIEKLLVLRPDLVIANGLERRDAAGILAGAGIQLLEFRIRSLQEMFEAIREIGRLTGRLQQAEKAVEAMQTNLRQTAEKFRQIPPSQRPKVFVEIWHDPITTAGGSSFVNDVIIRAGGINVAGNISQAYPCINPEKVIEWNPDIIILCSMESKDRPQSRLAERIGWSDISAVRQGRIINDISPDNILRPGPRLIEAVKTLAECFYGTATGKCAPGNEPQESAGKIR